MTDPSPHEDDPPPVRSALPLLLGGLALVALTYALEDPGRRALTRALAETPAPRTLGALLAEPRPATPRRVRLGPHLALLHLGAVRYAGYAVAGRPRQNPNERLDFAYYPIVDHASDYARQLDAIAAQDRPVRPQDLPPPPPETALVVTRRWATRGAVPTEVQLVPETDLVQLSDMRLVSPHLEASIRAQMPGTDPRSLVIFAELSSLPSPSPWMPVARLVLLTLVMLAALRRRLADVAGLPREDEASPTPGTSDDQDQQASTDAESAAPPEPARPTGRGRRGRWQRPRSREKSPIV